MKKSNYKVPIAVLCCFLTAFILQGILKTCGVFVFEKALDWNIFKAIDNSIFLQIIYYTITVAIIMYCLSFSLTKRAYSKRWYHYVLIFGFACGGTVLRLLVPLPNQIQVLVDIALYVLIPLSINFSTKQQDRAFKNDFYGVVSTIGLQLLLYFAYLGLTYWSGVLASFLPISPTWINSSSSFLIRLEVYIALVSFMIASNILVRRIKGGEEEMFLPVDIASKEARLLAKKAKLEKDLAKVNKDLDEK